jgi:hypothetical protein
MSNPISGNDPNAAYDVVPKQGWPDGWWTVTCNGIPVRHFRQQGQCGALRHGCRVPRKPDSDEVCRSLRGWSREFDEPIPLPDGGELRTLIDAGRYVDALPRSMLEREEWQAVMEVLLSAVKGREPVRLVQVALTLALQESKRSGRF